MDRVAINLGFIQIYWYSIFIFLGLFFAFWYILSEIRRTNEDEETVTNTIFYLFLFGIIGARIYYVLFNFNYYMNRPLEIFEIWNGGLAIHGGIIAGLLYLLVNYKRLNIRLLKLFDLLVGGLILGQAIGRWGNFFNQEAFGKIVSASSLDYLPTFIKGNMYINGVYREPLFLYESFFNFIGFLIIFLFLRRRASLRIGTITSFYFVWYGLLRFIIEFNRVDSLYLGNIRVAQIVSILMIISGVVIYIYSRKGMRLQKLYNKLDMV